MQAVIAAVGEALIHHQRVHQSPPSPAGQDLLFPALWPCSGLLWAVFCRRAIRAAFKNKERAAILTTHYMEEADAVCDRVAILVSGQLRYSQIPPGAGGTWDRTL